MANMSHPLHVAVKRITYNLFQNVANTRVRKRAIIKFCEKTGLVYLGSVNQHSDDHQIVRGFTVSSSHIDNNYSVGSVGGYNITIVDRSDAVWQPDGSIAMYNWLIMSFDLHTKQDTPHFFLNANNHSSKPYEMFFRTFPAMKAVHLGTFENYGTEFTSRFSIYTQPSISIEVERLFPASTAMVLGAHFWPLSAELHEGKLYVYSDEKRVTACLLEAMLESGLWLTEQLDLQSELV